MTDAPNKKMPRRLRQCFNGSDLRAAAKRALPYPIFNHIDGGCDDEVMLTGNNEAFDRYRLKSRVCSGVESVDASTTVLGQRIEWPYFASPAGGMRYLHRDGEIGVARGAHANGTAFAMSAWTNTTPEDLVAAAPDGPRIFQLQPCRSRDLLKDMLDKARETNFPAMIMTVDNPIHGNRERDARSGFGVPANFTLGAWLSILGHPRWAMSVMPLPGFGLYDRYMNGRDRDLSWLANELVTNTTWDDLAWACEQWDGPFAIKGVMCVEDARRAVDAGVSSIILSNQGARHFDQAPAPIDVLPAVMDAVGDQVEVIVDGGIRRGTDVIKALALGARACSGARLYAYGLGAGGQAGVEHALNLLRAEVESTMIFMGAATLADLTADSIMAVPPCR